MVWEVLVAAVAGVDGRLADARHVAFVSPVVPSVAASSEELQVPPQELPETSRDFNCRTFTQAMDRSCYLKSS